MAAIDPEPVNAARRKGGPVFGQPVPLCQLLHCHGHSGHPERGKLRCQQAVNNPGIRGMAEQCLNLPAAAAIAQMRRCLGIEQFGKDDFDLPHLRL